MNRKHLTALATAVSLVAALTACSSDSDAPEEDQAAPGAEENTSEDTAAEAGAEEAADGAEEPAEEPAEEGADAAEGGSSDVEIIIAGETIDIANPTVQCADTGDTFAISLASEDIDEANGESFGALLTSGDDPTVSSVALSRSEGVSVAYIEGTDGSAEVTVDGNTYVITGEAMGVDLADPTAVETVEFSFTVTCP
ncbi:MAG: lipoprotein LpqH [Gulosibacter sp.]|uniref:lipoprotein LpqH n=1 Tax=Gulosibacter sp. TaxID=2817531 RepID=UPI003F9216FA